MGTTIRCPACRENISVWASVCPRCQSSLFHERKHGLSAISHYAIKWGGIAGILAFIGAQESDPGAEVFTFAFVFGIIGAIRGLIIGKGKHLYRKRN